MSLDCTVVDVKIVAFAIAHSVFRHFYTFFCHIFDLNLCLCLVIRQHDRSLETNVIFKVSDGNRPGVRAYLRRTETIGNV